MRKFFCFIMILLVMPFYSCSKMKDNSSYSETENSKEKRESIVFRTCHSFVALGRLCSVVLEDKTILHQAIRFTYDELPSEFFFLQKGDTVVYSGDKVLEIRFKSE